MRSLQAITSNADSLDGIRSSAFSRPDLWGSCCGNSFLIYDKLSAPKDLKITDFDRHVIADLIKSAGVDSALVLSPLDRGAIRLRIFERDASESNCCGNGGLLVWKILGNRQGTIECRSASLRFESTDDGIFFATDAIRGRRVGSKFIVESGEPHLVLRHQTVSLSRFIQFASSLQREYPSGINVNCISQLDVERYSIRTYERGVCRVTASCGTGSLAAFHALEDKILAHRSTPGMEFESSGGIHTVWRDQRKGLVYLFTAHSSFTFGNFTTCDTLPLPKISLELSTRR